MAWDSLDCKEDLVTWSWVTSGCETNRGFMFSRRASSVDAQPQLVSGLPGAVQCVYASTYAAGGALKLGKCPTTPDPGWDFDEATGLMHRGTKGPSSALSALMYPFVGRKGVLSGCSSTRVSLWDSLMSVRVLEY